jgi:hypothetical protein
MLQYANVTFLRKSHGLEKGYLRAHWFPWSRWCIRDAQPSNMARTSWVIVIFGDDILTERLGFKALTGAIPRKRAWPVTIWDTRTFTTASPKVRMTHNILTRLVPGKSAPLTGAHHQTMCSHAHDGLICTGPEPLRSVEVGTRRVCRGMGQCSRSGDRGGNGLRLRKSLGLGCPKLFGSQGCGAMHDVRKGRGSPLPQYPVDYRR